MWKRKHPSSSFLILLRKIILWSHNSYWRLYFLNNRHWQANFYLFLFSVHWFIIETIQWKNTCRRGKRYPFVSYFSAQPITVLSHIHLKIAFWFSFTTVMFVCFIIKMLWTYYSRVQPHNDFLCLPFHLSELCFKVALCLSLGFS